MSVIKYVAFLLYKYYTGGKRPDNMPYFRTMVTMTLLALFHLFQILILLGKGNFLAHFDNPAKKLALFIILLPIYLFLTLTIKKEELVLMVADSNRTGTSLKMSYTWLIVYGILSFSMIFILGIALKK